MNVYSGLPDIKDVVPRGPADDALMAEIAGVLNRHGAIDRFGVTLLHTHFPIHDGEIMLEETDETLRVQKLSPVPKHEAVGGIETSWRLTAEGVAMSFCICPDVKEHYHKKV